MHLDHFLNSTHIYIAVSNLLNISIAVCREGVSYCTCHHLEVDYMLAKALR